MVSVYPVPTEDDLASFYNQSYQYENFIDKFKNKKYGKYFKLYLEEISKYAIGRSLLEIGCSYGYFLKKAEEQGWSVLGTDISQETVKYAKEILGLKVILASLEEVDFSENRFDVVVMWHVLEHLLAPDRAISKIKTFLKENGLLCLRLPNVSSLSSRLNGKDWSWLIPPAHLHHFNPYTIRLFLENNNLEVLFSKTQQGDSRNLLFLTLQALSSRIGLLPLLKRKAVTKQGERVYIFSTNKDTGRIVRYLNYIEKTTDVFCEILKPFLLLLRSLELGEEIFVIARKR